MTELKKVHISSQTCYEGDTITNHESLCLFLGSLFARIENLEESNKELINTLTRHCMSSYTDLNKIV